MRKLMNIIVSIIGMVSLGLAGAYYYAFRIMPQNALDSTKKNAPVDAITGAGYPFIRIHGVV